jgi:hypothetical protein
VKRQLKVILTLNNEPNIQFKNKTEETSNGKRTTLEMQKQKMGEQQEVREEEQNATFESWRL